MKAFNFVLTSFKFYKMYLILFKRYILISFSHFSEFEFKYQSYIQSSYLVYLFNISLIDYK